MTNGFALNHDKHLHIYFFSVKRQANNYVLSEICRKHSRFMPIKFHAVYVNVS